MLKGAGLFLMHAFGVNLKIQDCEIWPEKRDIVLWYGAKHI